MIYKTKGTCSTSIDVELKDGVIDSVKFTGGCNGNLQGISALVKGMTPKKPSAVSRESAAVLNLLPALISWHMLWKK